MKETYVAPALERRSLVPTEQLSDLGTDFDQLGPDGIVPGTPDVPTSGNGELIVP